MLIIFVPLAIAATAFPWSSDLALTLNFLAIISLSGPVNTACKDMSVHMNELVGRIFVAFSENAVELGVRNTSCKLLLQINNIQVSTVALTRGEIVLLQRSILGSIMCYVLLVSVILYFNYTKGQLLTVKDHGLMLPSQRLSISGSSL